MKLPLDPNLPLPDLPNWPRRLTEHLTRLLRQWAATINQMLGPAWEDLRFPAQSINPQGGATAPTIDNSTWLGTLIFTAGDDCVVSGIAQLPHSWERDTTVSPHIHWFKPAADANAEGVGWQFRYLLSAIGATLGAYTALAPATLVSGNLSQSAVHCLSTFPDISLTGYGESSCILWELSRTGSSDSYSAENVHLLEFDIHYRAVKAGTPQRAPA